MAQWTGKLTLSQTGTRYFTLGSFLPTWAKIYITDDTSGTDPDVHINAGETDGTNQSYESSYKNGANELYINGTDRIVKHIDHNGTNFIYPVEAEFLDFVVLGGSINTIKLNVITASTSFKAIIVCGD